MLLSSNKITFQKQSILVLLLLICLLALAFLFQGSRGLWQPDEGYYVGTAVTMMKKGDLLIPRLGETIFLEKPPMTYWSIITGLKLFGHCEFGVRALNALYYAATVLVVALLGYHLSGKKQDAIMAGVIYATMIIPFIAANFVTPDTLLVLWTTFAAFFFWKSAQPNARHIVLWKLLLCAAVGLGFLTKGPAVLLPCGGMFVFLAVRRQIIKYFWTPWSLVGFLIFCLAGLSWYIWIALKVPGAISYFLDNQVWGRLVSEKYNRNPGIAGALLYLPILIFGSMPWSIIWWRQGYRLRDVPKKRWWVSLKDRPVALFLLSWFFVPLVILCFASSKLAFYSLPVFPALALATVRLWNRQTPSSLSIQTNGKIILSPRLVLFTACWIVLLLGAKFALAFYPTYHNARALWKQIEGYLPEDKYEIVTIDEHADALLFYGAVEVENVTKKQKPYPTFSIPEHIIEELKDVSADRHYFFFLIRQADDIIEMKNILNQENITFEQINLPFERALLVCRPPVE